MLEVENWPLSKRLYYYQHLAALRHHDHDQMEADMPADDEVPTASETAVPGMHSPSPTGEETDPVDMASVHPDLRKYDTVVTTGGGGDD